MEKNTVLINGGSRGIGASMVRLFSSRGYKVAFTYKDSSSEALALAAECGAIAIQADASVEADVRRAVEDAGEALGGIYCLINNAAVSSFSLLSELSLEQWNKTIAVNLTGPFLYCREVIPAMVREGGGVIINISSVWGLCGSSCEAHYSASKAGLIGLTKALAKELGPSSIRVNAIAPGVINTSMNASLTEEDMKALADETPLSRIGESEEVAEVACFLASDCASFITGEVMNVSGGFLI